MSGNIQSRLARADKLTASQLDKLQADIHAQFDTADETDDLEAMEQLVAANEALDEFRETGTPIPMDLLFPAEAEAVVEDETETAVADEEPASEVVDEVAPETASEAEAEAAVEVVPEVDSETPTDVPEASAEVAPPVIDLTDSTPTTEISEEVPAMAAGATFSPPADRQPIAVNEDIRLAITAGADIPGLSAGAPFSSLEQISKAFSDRLNTLKRAMGADGDQHSVATITASVPESRQLDYSDIEGNLEKIRAVTSPEALVASGGFCAPLPVKYDIFGLGTGGRPLRDALPSFQATRGGIRFVQPPALGAYLTAIGDWSEADDIAAGETPGEGDPPAPTKPFLHVDCANEDTAKVEACTLTLEFGNLLSRAFPELVTRHNQLALIQQARYAEQKLWAGLVSESTAVTSAFALGFARDWLHAVGRAAAAYRARHRMDPNASLRVVAPIWLLDAVREDIASGLPGDKLAESDAVIQSYLTARNVRVSWYLDDASFIATQGAGALVAWPSTFTWLMFSEGTFLFLDGGTLDLGIVRDSTLVAKNDYRTFVETFEGLAKIGLESMAITTTSHAVGSMFGTTTAV